VLIFLGPFALPPSNPSPPFPHDHDLYMLAPTKYNTFCPKTYVIKVISVIIVYTTIGLCHSLGLKFVIRTCVTKLMSWKCHMSLIINQAKVCVTWGWVDYVIQPMSIKFVVSLRLMSLGLSLTYICHWGLCEFGLFHWVLCHLKHDPCRRAYISWKFLLFKSNHLDLVLMLCFIAFTIVIGLQSLLKPLY